MQFADHRVECGTERSAGSTRVVVGVERHQETTHDRPHRALERLEGDIAGEPIGDDDIGFVGHDVATLDVADPLTVGGGGPGRIAQELEALLDEGAALPGFFADRQQADLGALDTEAVAGVDTTHLGELDEPLGLALGVGAGVEQGGGGRARDRDRRGDRRTLNAFDAAHPKQRGRHRCAGVARRDHCRGVAVSDRLGCSNERGVLHLANARAGLGVHGDDFGGLDHRQVAGIAHLAGLADEHDGHAEFVDCAPGSLDNGVGGVVAAHGIDSDGQHVISRLRSPDGRRTSRSCRRPGAGASRRRSSGRCCERYDRRAMPRPCGSGSSTWTSSASGQP